MDDRTIQAIEFEVQTRRSERHTQEDEVWRHYGTYLTYNEAAAALAKARKSYMAHRKGWIFRLCEKVLRELPE